MQTLIIRIEDRPADGGAFPVRGLSWTQGEPDPVEHAAGEIPWPLPPLDSAQPDRDAIGDARQTMLAAGDPDFAPGQVGRYLWRLLAGTPVGGWWEQVDQLAADGAVRTMLDVQATALKQLPWELLTCEPDGRRPFQSHAKPWARVHGSGADVWERAQGSGADPGDLPVPVRMLVVVGDPQDPNLKVDDELDAIVGALRGATGRWHVDHLVKPTQALLRSALEDLRPDVLHVIAHGAVVADGAVLVVPVDQERVWELTVADVANVVPSPAPRLVVLNACRSGTAGADTGLVTSWSFAEAFRHRGSAAVVTMLGNIPSAAAVPFSAAFYRAVAAGAAVDVAAARGRAAAYDARRVDQDDRSWAMPSLHLRTRADRVIPVALAVDADLVQRPPYREAYQLLGAHVDRAKERWELLRNLAPNGGPPQRSLLLVSGAERVGKSAVVKAALLSCHLRGSRVVYADLQPCRNSPWLPVLRHLRDQLRLWLPAAATEPVRRFDHELAFLRERRIPDDYVAGSARADDGGDFDHEAVDFKDWIRRVFASFRGLLAATAGDQPLLLALDHLDQIYGPELEEFVVPELLGPIARGEVANVYAVLVGEAGWLQNLRVADPMLSLPEPITVPRFCFGELPRLGREYCARIDRLPVSPEVVELLEVLRNKNAAREATGDELEMVLKIVQLQAG